MTVTSLPGTTLCPGMTDLGNNDYKAWLRRLGASTATIRQRTIFAEAWLRKWRTWNVPVDRIADWLVSWRSAWTRCTYYSHLRSLYTWLTETKQVESDPMASIKRPRPPRPHPRPLTAAEALTAIQAATGDLRAHLMLGQLEGLRAHEIAKVRGEEVTEHGVYVIGKGEQGAMVPTHPAVWHLSREYPRVGFWFPSDRSAAGHILAGTVTARVSKHFRALGIVGSSHRNRHTFGTTLMKGGTNLRIVQELMRHTSLTTTAAYLGVDDNELAAAVARLPSVA